MLNVNLLRKQFKGRRKVLVEHRVNRMQRMVLREGQELTSFIEVLNTAMQFLGEKKNETSELPVDSPERLLIDAIDGILHKHSLTKEEAPANETIRQKISGLVSALDEHISGQGTTSSDFLNYLGKLKEGLLELHNSIEPNEEVEPPPTEPGGEEAGGAGSPEPGAEPEPEQEQPPEDEISQLSRQLGLNNADQPPQPPRQ